jgi:hypothetical protein
MEEIKVDSRPSGPSVDAGMLGVFERQQQRVHAVHLVNHGVRSKYIRPTLAEILAI